MKSFLKLLGKTQLDQRFQFKMKWILTQKSEVTLRRVVEGIFMKKLLIIGNGHVGSLKRTWDGMRSTYDMDVELSFADRSQALVAHIKNGVLFIENDPHAERGPFILMGVKRWIC